MKTVKFPGLSKPDFYHSSKTPNATLNYEVPAKGSTDTRIVLVGDAPTKEDYLKGNPFEGGGYHFDRLLASAGLKQDDVRMTNLVKERVSRNKVANLSYEKLKLWECDLIEELNLLPDVKVIVPLGNAALRAVSGRGNLTNMRGSVLPPVDVIDHDCIIIPTHHPSVLNYNYPIWPLIVADFMKVKKIAEQSDPFEFPSYSFLMQPTFDQVMDTLTMLEGMGNTLMTIDVETPHALLSCVGIAWSRSDAICIPFFWGDGRNYWNEVEEAAVWRRLSEILPKLNLTNQNVLFDWEVMRLHRIMLKIPTFDPMLMHACLYSELPHKLDVITSIYTNMEFFKKDEKEDKGSALKAGREREHWKYNCFDCVSALWCIEEMITELVEEDMMDPYITLFADMIEPIFLMNTRGIRTDLEKLEEVRSELTKKTELIDGEITRAAGHEVNVNSPKQVANLFYTELCMTPHKTTGEDDLKKLAYKYQIDLPLLVIENRKHKKLMSLFAEKNIDDDGRIRCQYGLSKTSTGRINSKKKHSSIGGRGMNLQNVKTSGHARSLFVPEKGHIMIGADQEQAEALVVARLSKDPTMNALFESERSIHIENALNLFGEEISKDDPRYRIAKALVHGGNYGIGPWGFAYVANVPFREAKEKLALYYATYPGIKGFFHEYVKKQIRDTRMLHNPFGRRQVFFGRFDDVTFRAGFAFIPQSTITDVNKIAIKRIYKTHLPLMDTHDGMMISVPINDEAEGIQALRDAYDIEFEIWGEPVKIPIEIMIGENWHDLKEV